MVLELVKFLVSNLVQNFDKVEIIENFENEKTCVITIKVEKDEIGRLIGKNGKVASSIRTIVKSISSRDSVKYIIKIQDL